MNWRRVIELPLAFVLKRVMAPPRPGRAAREPEPEPAAAPAAPPGRGSVALLALVALIVGCGLLIPFDEWWARLAGVLALFAFIVAGVFAIATPALLDQE
jgi:hypothetical protein